MIAKEENITRASEKLNITQPTLSRQIQDLEEEIGATLLIRGKRKVTLTDAGFLYLQRTKEILRLVDKAERDVQNESDTVAGIVTIGCVETNVAEYLMEAVALFMKKYPLVTFEFYNGFSDDIKEKLDLGTIDVGILIEPVEAAKYELYQLPIREKWGLIANADDPIAKKSNISIEDILDLPLIVTNRDIVKKELESWLGHELEELNIVATQNLLTNTALLLQKLRAYIVVVEGAFTIRPSENLTFIPFSPTRETGHVLAWKKNKVFHTAVSKFIEEFK
jgi:DNA-binding transcriptional LysR family regulator